MDLIHRIITEYISIQKRIQAQPIIYDGEELYRMVKTHPLFPAIPVESFAQINALFDLEKWQSRLSAILLKKKKPLFRFYVGLSSYASYMAWANMPAAPVMTVYSNTNLHFQFYGKGEITIFTKNKKLCTCTSAFDLFHHRDMLRAQTTAQVHPDVLADFLFLLPTEKAENIFLGTSGEEEGEGEKPRELLFQRIPPSPLSSCPSPLSSCSSPLSLESQL